MVRLVLGVRGPRKPLLGTELSGDVVAIGKKVSRFAVGDRVFAFLGASMGAYAEYRCMAETGVCSGTNAELVRSLGADTVIDYTRDTVETDGSRYDVIMDTVGAARAEALLELLNPGGRLLLVAAGLREMLLTLFAARRSGKRVIAGPATERPEYVQHRADLVRTGAYKAVIDRTFRVDQIVDAHRYVDTGRKRGNVVIIFDGSAE